MVVIVWAERQVVALARLASRQLVRAEWRALRLERVLVSPLTSSVMRVVVLGLPLFWVLASAYRLERLPSLQEVTESSIQLLPSRRLSSLLLRLLSVWLPPAP